MKIEKIIAKILQEMYVLRHRVEVKQLKFIIQLTI